MLKDLFRNRLFFGIFIFALIVLMGCGLFYGSRVANQEPVKIYKPVEAETPALKPPSPGETHETGHWHGDEWHVEPHETEKLPLVESDETSERFEAPGHSGGVPLPPSSVPDNIPEHLKFPEEWKIPYYSTFSEGANPISPEDAQRGISMLREIISDYNPQRPIGDIWNQFIEYEKMYRAYAEQELGYTPFAAFSANRAEWQYEQTWTFPEIMEIVVGDSTVDEKNILFNTRLIAMGEQSPDWNEHILHDGRAFYLRDDTRYEFRWGTEERGGSIGRSMTADKSAPLVVIHADKTSDQELKALGWWNFHTNPYTLQPVNYQPYNIINKGARNRR